ncbi:MAG: class I SAM-dependent RNA methyltransferase [Provencibacterium sp.]|jgi:putative N6-adenine-specific DNA methylase|nr:class I SAM-dependent RNA methyltransferase [Provencibacterium sp.]
MKYKIVCPCLFGLESVLKQEVVRMGGEEITATDGRVSFLGDAHMIARANLGLRTAERVLICLGEFRADTFTELFDYTCALPFEQFIGRKDRFPVKGWSLDSKLHSVPDCQAIIKKAIVRRLGGKYGISWFEETGSLFQIRFTIRKDSVSIMIDTSGEGLHKRGYRKNSVLAPIKETLAAGMIDLARVYDDSFLCDPFCGSGTILIEGAMHAMRIAPGLRRRFCCEEWEIIPRRVFNDERQRAFDLIRRDAAFEAVGYDIDADAVELCSENAKKAGVGSRIHVSCQPVSQLQFSRERAVIICNPPYGERLLERKEAYGTYREMGKAFRMLDARKYIISPSDEFEQLYGQPADRRRKLYNGMMRCQLFCYNGKREPKAQPPAARKAAGE